jgi:hypothetical protein
MCEREYRMPIRTPYDHWRLAIAWWKSTLLGLCGVGLVLAGDCLAAGPEDSTAAGPTILYTDITSGPNTGGERDQGIYLSVFGRGFGQSLSNLRLLIGGVEVANYRYLGPSRGRPDVQQLSVQIGHLGNPAPGTALPIQLFVNDKASNADLRFTVIPGNIYFVSPNGSDDGAGTFEKPFKSVQKPAGVRLTFAVMPASVAGAYGLVHAGDFIVLRDGTYAGVGFGGTDGEGYLLQTLNKSGCPPPTRCPQGGGSSTGPITLMGYPAETAFLDRTNRLGDNKFGGGISSADSRRQALGYGAWWNIVDLKIESGFYDGPINTQRADLNPLGGHWRIVNNDLSADSCRVMTKCRAGAIAGAGIGQYWVGNSGHDIYDGPEGSIYLENHGIYIGGPGSYEIAYNVFARIVGGNGIQIQSGTPVDDVSIHHNIIHDVGKHGLNFVAGSHDHIVVWSNLIYNTAGAGVRFGSDVLHDLKLYNNTFFNTGMIGDRPSSGALTNDMDAQADQMDIRNNIFWPHVGSGYNRGTGNADFAGAIGTIAHNLWYGGSGSSPAATFSTESIEADPRFVSVTPGNEDFHLQPGSRALIAGTDRVASLVTSDIEVQRPEQAHAGSGSFYLGAYAR